MNPHDDSSFDELLRGAMAEEADGIVPAGDGLARIQQRIRNREGRVRWFRPALALSSVAALAAAGVGVAVLVSNSGNDKLAPTPGTGTSLEPTASSTDVPVVDHGPFPAQAIFPFTTADAEQGWEQDYASGGTQWEADPTQVAQHWVQDFLDQPDVDRVISTTDDGTGKLVTLGRVLQAEGQNLFPVTAVHLSKYGSAWIVTGASDPNSYLSFNTPTPGDEIVTPVAITGPGFGVDEAVQLDVRDATSTTSYGTATVSFGNGTGIWRQSINFNLPTSPVGVLVAVDHSPADGGPNRIAAEQVRFAPAEPSQPPQYFYAVKNNRITKFASRTGSAINYLTMEQPGGGVSDPQLYGSDVYYLQGAGTCGNALMKVPSSADGSAVGQSVESPSNGYVISSYAVSDSSISVFESTCDPARSPQGRLVTTPTGSGGTAHTIDFPAFPPTIIGDPTFDVAGSVQYLTAIVKTGTQSSLVRYDVYGDTSPTPDRQACKGIGPEDGEPEAIERDQSGTLWVALRNGSAMNVMRCGATSGPKVAFTVPGNDQPLDLDVSSDGTSALLTDYTGKVWRWDGSGNPDQLTTAIPLDHVTW
jgi:hypothetical protein